VSAGEWTRQDVREFADWGAFVDVLEHWTITADKATVPYFSPGVCDDGHPEHSPRLLEHFREASILGFDLDGPKDADDVARGEPDEWIGQLRGRLQELGLSYFMCTSHSNDAKATPGRSRFRLVLPLSRPVTDAEQYKALVRYVGAQLLENRHDHHPVHGVAVFYMPSHPPGASRIWMTRHDAGALDVDAILPHLPPPPEPAPPPDPELLARISGEQRVREARRALAQHGAAIEGQGGDLHTLRAAMICDDWALTDDEADAVLREWNETCEPPWSLVELDAKRRSARRSRKSRPGCAAEQLAAFLTAPVDLTHVPAAAANAASSAASEPADAWVSAADIVERPIEWLWVGWLPRGEIVLLESSPKAGKSTVMREVAAAISTGRALPGLSPTVPEHVLWISTEEDPSRMVVPGLRVAGADLSRVTLRRQDDPWSVSGAAELVETIRRTGATLVVIDAVKDVLELPAEEREVPVRDGMRRLLAIARETDATIVAIRHWKKGASSAGDRGAGSVGYRAVATTIIAVKKEPEHGRSVFAHVESRLPGLQRPLTLRMVDQGMHSPPSVEWTGEVEAEWSIEDVAQERTGRGATKCQAAKDYLLSGLAAGPRRESEITAATCEAVGCSPRTLATAKKELEIVSERKRDAAGGFAWWWRLPEGRMQTDPPGAETLQPCILPNSES
jgi:hypothetical protein